ncbi:hypothetical protein [Streptomyces macrosporus]|uniref:Secreted protein n=1 Tax=Streptomyces macrosporus TaxID=44032 RepID=A0ABN3JJZ2_9ACTN
MRRRTTLAALAPLALALPLLGCSAVQNALDCANTAVVIVDSANDLQQAVSDGAENPAEIDRSLDRIDQNLDKIGESTDGGDVGKVVEDLRRAVDNARTAADNGEAPDVTPVVDAADELSKVCTPN